MAIKENIVNIEFTIIGNEEDEDIIIYKIGEGINLRQCLDVIYISENQINDLIQVLNKLKPKATRETRR